MITRRLVSMLFGSLALAGAVFADELVVIAHPVSGVVALERTQVVHLFLGRTRALPFGERATIYEVDAYRAPFYRQLVRQEIAEVDAYWARLRFSGRTQPPQLLEDGAAAVDRVATEPHALAAVASADIDERVRVVFRLPLP